MQAGRAKIGDKQSPCSGTQLQRPWSATAGRLAHSARFQQAAGEQSVDTLGHGRTSEPGALENLRTAPRAPVTHLVEHDREFAKLIWRQRALIRPSNHLHLGPAFSVVS